MKEYKKTVLLSILVALLPMAFGILLWNRLPEEIVTHWGMNGEANGWSSRGFVVFGLPCSMALVQAVVIAVTLNDPKRRNIQKKLLLVMFWLVPVLSVVVCGVIYMTALGIGINVMGVVSMVVGVLFIALGICMPGLKQNYTVGIKLPWTLHSEDNWNRTHRVGGKSMIAAGILIMISGLTAGGIGEQAAGAVMIAAILICLLIPSVYSFWLYRKGI